jgi:hypothetical protein
MAVSKAMTIGVATAMRGNQNPDGMVVVPL